MAHHSDDFAGQQGIELLPDGKHPVDEVLKPGPMVLYGLQHVMSMLGRTFNPGFRIELHHKDLGIVTAAAREAGVVVPLGAVVAQLMASAVANGDGGLDHSALLRGVLRLSGQDPNATPTQSDSDSAS